MSERPYQPQTSSNTTTATTSTQDVAPQTTAKAQEIGERLQHDAQRLVEETKNQGQTLLQDQKRAVAEQVSGLADALHRTSEQLQNDHSAMAHYTEQAAEGLDRFSRTLKERDLGSLVGEVESFARHQPGAFIGGAALLGFLAARFFKSSADHSVTAPSYTSSSGATYGAGQSSSYATPASSPAHTSTSSAPSQSAVPPASSSASTSPTTGHSAPSTPNRPSSPGTSSTPSSASTSPMTGHSAPSTPNRPSSPGSSSPSSSTLPKGDK